MPPTTNFEFGDVLLVPFPFSNQTAGKQRPAVVVSSVAYNRERLDLVILAITSQFRPTLGLGEAPTPAERRKWRLIGRGLGIHWEDLDEDISIEGLLSGKPSGESQESFGKWLKRRTARPSGRRRMH